MSRSAKSPRSGPQAPGPQPSGKQSGRLRLSSGTLGGRWIAVPASARPTEARVREALLSAWQDRLPDARLLDLFAGSGAVGLEALGLGVAAVVAVEEDGRALRLLRRNADALGVGERFRIVRRSLPDGLAQSLESGPGSGAFDLIFADPPYGFRAYRSLLAAAAPFLAQEGEMAIEHTRDLDLDTPVPDGEDTALELHRQRTYGGSQLSFFRHRSPGEPSGAADE